jgi:hypothetical protein
MTDWERRKHYWRYGYRLPMSGMDPKSIHRVLRKVYERLAPYLHRLDER